ncbi:hypothetical protein IJG14_00245 [bacterium]|nr:hypothetical protein [bacterium]
MAFIIGITLFRIAEIIEKYCHIENLVDNFIVYFLFFGFPIVSMLIKIFIFPILYKIKFLSNIKDFLERFATDKNFLIKVLFSVLIFDIIVYLLTIFFDESHYINPDYINKIKGSFGVYLLAFFGVLPCYMSFLIWYKWTHRKQISRNN